MSYWSENPEAYDECELMGIADKLQSFVNLVDRGPFEYLVEQLQHSNTPVDKKLLDALREWANIEITDRINTWFERYVP